MSMADRIAVLRDGRLEQLATPQELYANPATRFVASFIGSANLLDGVVRPGRVDVPGVGAVEVAAHALPDGTPATAVVRPEDVDLTADAATAALSGVVVDTYFLGGASTLSIEVAGLAAPIIASVHGTSALTRGDAVGVRFGRAAAVSRDAATVDDQDGTDGSAEPTGVAGTPQEEAEGVRS